MARGVVRQSYGSARVNRLVQTAAAGPSATQARSTAGAAPAPALALAARAKVAATGGAASTARLRVTLVRPSAWGARDRMVALNGRGAAAGGEQPGGKKGGKKEVRVRAAREGERHAHPRQWHPSFSLFIVPLAGAGTVSFRLAVGIALGLPLALGVAAGVVVAGGLVGVGGAGASAAAVSAGAGVVGAGVAGRALGLSTPAGRAGTAAALSAHGPADRKRQQSRGARQDGPLAAAAAAAAAVEVQHRPWPTHTIS
jgi:hypothetical protein